MFGCGFTKSQCPLLHIQHYDSKATHAPEPNIARVEMRGLRDEARDDEVVIDTSWQARICLGQDMSGLSAFIYKDWVSGYLVVQAQKV